MAVTVALTGATGFIGSAVARRLQHAGLSVRALVRPTADTTGLPSDLERITGALDHPDSLARLVRGAGVVVHCAGVVRGRGPVDFDPVNVEGVARLAAAAAAVRPAPAIVHVSSLAARHPGLSAYAASKWRGEQELRAAPAWTVLRPPVVYGPGDRELLPLLRVMARGLAPLVGRRDGRLSLVYVEDLADAVVALVALDGTGRIFEIHDGRPSGYSVAEIVAAVERWRGRRIVRVAVPAAVVRVAAHANTLAARLRGRVPMLTPGKARELLHPTWACDNAPLTAATGWHPRFGLDEGLRWTLGDPGSRRARARVLAQC